MNDKPEPADAPKPADAAPPPARKKKAVRRVQKKAAKPKPAAKTKPKAAPVARKSVKRAVKKKAAKPAGKDNRSEFLRGILRSAPDTNLAAASAAWKAAGHKGTVPGSVFYTVRQKLGLTKKRRGAVRKMPPRPVAAAPADGYHAIERELDRLVAAAPDAHLAELLRQARRRASLAILGRS